MSSLADSCCLVDGKMAAGDALLSGDEEKPGKTASRTFNVDLLYDTVGGASFVGGGIAGALLWMDVFVKK